MIKYDKIRKIVGFKPNNKRFFRNEELPTILDYVGVEYDKSVLTKDLLSYFPGWIAQKTVSSHPSKANVDNILSKLEAVKTSKAPTEVSLGNIVTALGEGDLTHTLDKATIKKEKGTTIVILEFKC